MKYSLVDTGSVSTTITDLKFGFDSTNGPVNSIPQDIASDDSNFENTLKDDPKSLAVQI